MINVCNKGVRETQLIIIPSLLKIVRIFITIIIITTTNVVIDRLGQKSAIIERPVNGEQEIH